MISSVGLVSIGARVQKLYDDLPTIGKEQFRANRARRESSRLISSRSASAIVRDFASLRP